MTAFSNNHEQIDIRRFKSLLDDLKRRFPEYFQQAKTPKKQTILVTSITEQTLYAFNDLKLMASYAISSAEAGIGNQSGSNQTPLGVHQITEKIGENSQVASIFKARVNTHRIAKIIKTPGTKSEADNITSRILWLEGLEVGVNKGTDRDGNSVDSHSRYIYIHGTDEEGRLGEAASHGCIRMANQDVIELFDEVEVGCLAVITED